MFMSTCTYRCLTDPPPISPRPRSYTDIKRQDGLYPPEPAGQILFPSIHSHPRSYTDIKRKEGQSVFIRPHEGLFGLREWVEQGVAFQVCFGGTGVAWVLALPASRNKAAPVAFQ